MADIKVRRWRRTWTAQVAVAALAVGVLIGAAGPLRWERGQGGHDLCAVAVRPGGGQLRPGSQAPYRDHRRPPARAQRPARRLEAAGNNIYGQFAGGAAYLAKAVKDRQALYGDQQVTLFAGDNIGASPLANGLSSRSRSRSPATS